MSSIKQEKPERRLNTWKEIATFFGRDERTVKRWEARRGLPVRRVPGGGKASIYAYVSELNSWLDNADIAEPDSSAEAHAEQSDKATTISEIPSWQKSLAGNRIAILCALFVVLFAATGGVWLALSPRKPQPPSNAAYAFYLKGLYSWQTRTPAGIAQAVGDFNKSIAADPNFASAYAALADCYNLMQEFTATPASVAFPKAKIAAQRAIALDPNLASAHRSLAFVDFWWSHDVPAAMAEFHRALQIAPRSAQTHHWYATALSAIGDNEKALTEISYAEELAPGTTAIMADKGILLINAGRIGDAADTLGQVERAEPGYAPTHAYLAALYRQQNNASAMLREMRWNAVLRHDAEMLPIIAAGEEGYAAGGTTEMKRRMVAAEQANYDHGKLSAYFLAIGYGSLGNREKAIDFLREAIARREPAVLGMRSDPAFDILHADPRFAAMLAGLQLPPFRKA